MRFFSLFNFDPCRENENKFYYIFFVNFCLFSKYLCAGSGKVTPNFRFCLFQYWKMDSFLKIFRIQLFLKVLYKGMSLCSPLKFGICNIYNMFCTILIQYFTQNLFIFTVFSFISASPQISATPLNVVLIRIVAIFY